jgi:hypothetical protein
MIEHKECNSMCHRDNHKCVICGNEIDISTSTVELKQQISEIRDRQSYLNKSHDYVLQCIRELQKFIGDENWSDKFWKLYAEQKDQIHVLEKRLEEAHKYTSDCDMQRFNADEELRKRIENHSNRLSTLEQPYEVSHADIVKRVEHQQRMHQDHYNNNETAMSNIRLLTQAQDNMFERIDKLESYFESFAQIYKLHEECSS